MSHFVNVSRIATTFIEALVVVLLLQKGDKLAENDTNLKEQKCGQVATFAFLPARSRSLNHERV